MERNNRDVRVMIWMVDDMDDNGNRRERKGDESTSND